MKSQKTMSKWSEATCMRIREENSACQAFRVKLKTKQEIKRNRCVKAKKNNQKINQHNVHAGRKTWWQTARTLKTEDTNLQH